MKEELVRVSQLSVTLVACERPRVRFPQVLIVLADFFFLLWRSVVQRPTAWEVFESKPTCTERGSEWRKKNVNKNSHDIGLFLFGHFLIQERNANKVIKRKRRRNNQEKYPLSIERRSKRMKIVLLPNVSEKLEGEKCTRREKKSFAWDLSCQQVEKLAKLHTNPSGEEIYHVLRSESKIATTARKKVILWIFRLCCETNPHNSFENGISEQLEREQQNSGRWAICNSVFLRNFINREYLMNWQI